MKTKMEREWTTKAGLRATCWFVGGSHRCGYVEVPEGHPLHGIDYSEATPVIPGDMAEVEIGKKGPLLAFTATCDPLEGEEIRRSPDVVFDVHRGLTYAGRGGTYPGDGDGWWFGFDCNHYGDGSLGRYNFNDGSPVRTEGYVVNECEALARQIMDMFPDLAAVHITQRGDRP